MGYRLTDDQKDGRSRYDEDYRCRQYKRDIEIQIHEALHFSF